MLDCSAAALRDWPSTTRAIANNRRKFFDVWDGKKSPLANEVAERIGVFYAIRAKPRFAPPDEQLIPRADRAPLLASFFDWP